MRHVGLALWIAAIGLAGPASAQEAPVPAADPVPAGARRALAGLQAILDTRHHKPALADQGP